MLSFFKENLRRLRTEKALTQDGLGKRVNKGRTTINNWEKGISEPSIEELLDLANLFDVAVECLLLDVQVTGKVEQKEKGGNVQVNVQEPVQVKEPKVYVNGTHRTPKEDIEPYLTALDEARKTNDFLGIAVKGLEAANALLIKELLEIKEQNRLLNTTPPQIGSGLESARKTGTDPNN